MTRFTPPLILLALSLAFTPALPVRAQHTSKLWGQHGELWDPANSRLPDFTRVGYKQGAVPIPDWPVGVKVTDFGAIPDDTLDDSQAFLAAIAACPDHHAVLVPKGRFFIGQQLIITRDHFVLRGEDMHESIIFFPKYLDEVNIQQIGWSPGNERNTGTTGGFITMDGGTGKSIESLTLEFREQRKNGVWEYLGADPLAYTGGVTDSWVRNLVIRNYDLGFKVTRASNLSVINLILDQFPGRKSIVGSAPKGPPGTVPVDEYGNIMHIAGFDALFGVIPRAVNHSLFHNIQIRGYVMQPIDMNEFPRNNVFSGIRALLRAVGYHGGGSELNLYTDMNHFVSGVGGNRRTRETYWGIDYPLPEKALESTEGLIFVGYGNNLPEKITDTLWHEPVDPAKLTPRNLYLAQMTRLGKPLPEGPPRSEPSPFDRQVFSVLPSEDRHPRREPNDTSLPIDGPYIKFDLRDANLSSLARARLRLTLVQIRSTPFELTVFSVPDNTWSEATLSPDTAPEPGAKLDARWVREDELNPVLEFDVTDFVRNQVLNGDGIVSLTTRKTDGKGTVVFFRSSEGGMRPELLIERVPDPVPGPPSAPKDLRSKPLLGNIILDWSDNPESDIATYNVYRNPVRIGRDGYAESHASGLVTSDFVDVQSSGDWKVGMMDHRQVYRYTVTAVDHHGNESPRSTELIAATRHPASQPPAFNPALADSRATAGTPVSGSLQHAASDPEGDPLFFMKVDGPDWLHVAPDGTLSGTPGPGDTGTTPLTLQVTALGGSALHTLTLTVDPPPRLP